MSKTRRILLAGGILGAMGLFLVLGVWYWIGREGSTDLEGWIGKQIVGVLESHITPEVAYRTLDYQAPRTVVVDDLSFTRAGIPIMLIQRMRLELAEVPRRDRPIQVQGLELTTPQLRFVTGPNDELVGWSDFVRQEAVENPSSVPEGRRLSDVLVLRHVRIDDGEVVYQPADGEETMTLPGIDLTLRTPPAKGEPGWYQVLGTLSRDPIFKVEVDGRINLDTALLDLRKLTLAASLGEKQYEVLPPAVQRLLSRHQARGELTASFQGTIPLKEAAQTKGQLQARLADANFLYENLAVPVGSIELDLVLPGGKALLSVADIALHHGERTLASVARGLLELGAFPKADEPLDIRRLELQAPKITLVRAADGQLAGWSELARVASDEDEERSASSAASATTQPTALPRVRQARIQDGAVTFNTAAGADPVTLGGIGATVEPLDGGAAQTTYQVVADVNNDLVQAEARARYQPGSDSLEVESAQLSSRITPELLRLLPPQAATALDSERVQGDLKIAFDGRIPLNAPADTQGHLTAELKDGRFAVREFSIPVQSVRLGVGLPEGRAELAAHQIALRHEDQSLLAAEKVQATLAGWPQAGEPLVIERLDVQQPHVQLLTDDKGRLLGWSDLGGASSQGQASDDGNTAPHEPSSAAAAVEVRQLAIRDGRLLYGSAQGKPSHLDGVDAMLRTAPLPDEPGWQQVSLEVRRQDLVNAEVRGRLNLEAGLLDVRGSRISARMGAQQYALLPASWADLVRRYEVKGVLDASFEGRVPLAAPKETDGRVQLAVDDLNLRFLNTRLPVGGLRLSVNLPAGTAEISVDDLALTAGRRPFLSVQRIQLQLEGLPAQGEPVRARSLLLIRPRVSFIENERGEFEGWSNLSDPNAPMPRLSDHLLVRRVEARDGEVIYDPGDGTEPMSLDRIDVAMDLPPLRGEPGWYGLKGSTQRPGLLQLELDGRINLDNWLLRLQSARLQASLGEQQYETLPPQLQNLLRRHEVRGALTAAFEGHIPLENPAQAQLQGQATLQNARIAFEETVWPIQQLQVESRLSDQRLATQFNARLLGGTASGTVGVGLSGEQPLQLTWNVAGVRMEETLRVVQQGTPKYSGQVRSQGSLSAQLDRFAETVQGSGTLRISQGRLVNLPIIRPLLEVASKVALGVQPAANDNAQVSFQLRPRYVEINDLEVNSALIGLKGKGRIFYTRQVEMDVTAGVMQKLGNPLGRIGELLTLGERALVYEVSGTLSDTKVTVKPLGLGLQLPGQR